jgi:hypothetical protein
MPRYFIAFRYLPGLDLDPAAVLMRDDLVVQIEQRRQAGIGRHAPCYQ